MSLNPEVRGSVGLGTFPFAGPFTSVSTDAAKEILDRFFDGGGVYIDTSPTYAFGAIEELLGDYLATVPRDRFVLNTSCGYVRDGEAFRVSGRPDDVRADCEESLARLRLDRIDMYMSHIPDLETPLADTARALQSLKDEGIVDRIGVSNVSLDQLREYAESAEIDFVQNRLSLLNRNVDSDLAEFCASTEISIVAYQVIERGLLTDSVLGGLQLRDGDLRSKKPEFAPDVVQEIGGWVESELRPIAIANDCSLSALAVAWALAQSAVEVAQCGATSPSQVSELLKASELAGSSDVLAAADRAYESLERGVGERHGCTVRALLGLEEYDVYGGSASGK